MRNEYDSYVYIVKRVEKVILYILLYVDNNFMTSSSKKEINHLKEKLVAEFEMKDTDVAKRILEINVARN